MEASLTRQKVCEFINRQYLINIVIRDKHFDHVGNMHLQGNDIDYNKQVTIMEKSLSKYDLSRKNFQTIYFTFS